MLAAASRSCMAVLVLASLTRAAPAAEVTAAGGHFLSGLYAQWGEEYRRATGARLRFAPVGSTTGIQRLRKGGVTVAVSAIPLTPKELKASGLVQFPVAIGGIVPVVKIPNIEAGALVLDGATLARIYTGQITRWNDAGIRALNPSLPLPDRRIKPFYPTGNSGADFLFSSYLAQVSNAFAAQRRAGSLPGVTRLRGRTASEIALRVETTLGALGYVEYEHAKRRKLTFARLVNREGKVVTASSNSFRAAAMNADWPKSRSYYTVLTNQRGAESWPITGASFALMHGTVKDGPAAGEALRFFDWAYNRGAVVAAQSDFAPLPASLIDAVHHTWRISIRKANQPLWLVK